MRTLYFFATAYILMAAVACQPLREAKAELEVSRKAYRKPRRPLKPPRPATPKAKCRIEAISELFSHFANRGRAARNAASVAAQTDIKPLESTAHTRFQQSPSAKSDGIASPACPESPFKPRNKHFRFGGDEGGYVADADHAGHNAKLYDRPPSSTKLGIGADASGARVEEDRLRLSAEDKAMAGPQSHTVTRHQMFLGLIFGTMAVNLLWYKIRAAIDRKADIKAKARASENQQAALQQAFAESAALRASGSGGSKIQRRSLSSEDMAAHDASVRTSQPKDDRSLRKRSVVPIIKSEKAADKEDQSKTFTKRFNPLEIIGNAAERTRASIGSRASSFRDALQDRRRLVGPIAACIVSMLGLIGAIIYYEVKSQKLDNDLHGSNTEPAEPRPFPPVLRLKDVDNRDDSAFIQTSKDEKLHHTELRKRWDPVTAIIDCWQRRVEDSRRVAVVVMENASSSPRLLLVKLFAGAAALLGVSGALLWYGYRRQSDSTPKPQESKQPETASVPVPNRQHFAEVRHTMLNKRSLDVEPAAHVDVLSVEQGRPALLKREVTDEKIKRRLVRGNPGVTQIPLHKREVLQAQGATNYPTRRSLRRGDEHLEDLQLKDGNLVKRAIGAMAVEGPAEETLGLLDGAEREVERLHFRNKLQWRRRREAFRKAFPSKRILGSSIVTTLLLASIITFHQKLTAARKEEQAARRKARGAATYPVRGSLHKRDPERSAIEPLGREGARLLGHPVGAEFPGTDVAVRWRPAFSPLYRNILIGSAITLAAAIQGTFFWLAIRALKQQTPIQRAAKQQAEEERLQAGFKRSRRPGHLSKCMISRAAISLAVQDFKSLANKAPLKPAEKLARAQRLRKYASVGAGLAAVKGVESLVVYEILQSYKENKLVRQQLRKIKQQQQQQSSGYVGNSYYAPSHILSKRAKVFPLDEHKLAAAREYTSTLPYEIWKQNVNRRLRVWKNNVYDGLWNLKEKVFSIEGALLAGGTLLVGGITYEMKKYYDEIIGKKNPYAHASVGSPHKRDLSSQAQKEESHELAKREPARDDFVKATPSHILSKRFKVLIAHEDVLSAVREYTSIQPYEVREQNVINRFITSKALPHLKKAAMVIEATLLTVAVSLGITYGIQKLKAKKKTPNAHASIGSPHKRDLSSQAQKEESHELAKREPARDDFVKAGIPKMVPHNPAGGRRAELSQAASSTGRCSKNPVNRLKLEKAESAVNLVSGLAGARYGAAKVYEAVCFGGKWLPGRHGNSQRSEGRYKLRKRLMLPTNDGVPVGAALIRLLRQVAIESRRNGLIDPDPHQSQSSSDESKSRNRHTASPVPLFLIPEVTKNPAWKENIRKLQRKHTEDADDDERQEYHSSHHRSFMKRMEHSCLSGVFLTGHKAKDDVDDRMLARTHLPRPPRIALFSFFSRDNEKHQRLSDPARKPSLPPPSLAVDDVHQHAPSNAVAGQRREQQRLLDKRSTSQYSKLSITVFGTLFFMQGIRAIQAIKEHGRKNKHDISPYYSTYPAPRPRYQNTPRSEYTQSF
ncbi:hypothetical protein NDA13_006605 [Ustilago tritici]|nr:hypothetical protein NDA13_006605 [Ustilago tritici]